MGSVKCVAEEVARSLREAHPGLRKTVVDKRALAVGLMLEGQTSNTVELANMLPLRVGDRRYRWRGAPRRARPISVGRRNGGCWSGFAPGYRRGRGYYSQPIGSIPAWRCWSGSKPKAGVAGCGSRATCASTLGRARRRPRGHWPKVCASATSLMSGCLPAGCAPSSGSCTTLDIHSPGSSRWTPHRRPPASWMTPPGGPLSRCSRISKAATSTSSTLIVWSASS